MIRVHFQIAPHEVYNDAILYLAEGLREKGVQLSANRPYWPLDAEGRDWLLQPVPGLDPRECAAIVFSTYWFHHLSPLDYRVSGAPMPEEFLQPGRAHRLVLLDPEDGYMTTSWQPLFRRFDLVLRAKYNARCAQPANARPWVLGSTQRIRQAVGAPPALASRRRVIVCNFGFTHQFPHGVRTVALDRLLQPLSRHFPLDTRKTPGGTKPAEPWARRMWEQTEGKHQPDYYTQLATAQCVACFCGEFIPGLPFNPAPSLVGGRRAALRLAAYKISSRLLRRTDRIIQWDSWRFWECLAAGSVALHVDLEKYGVSLPVMPVNWRDYIGFDFEHLERDLARFRSLDSVALARIAASGHRWAEEHYAPAAAAQRFLAHLETLTTANHA